MKFRIRRSVTSSLERRFPLTLILSRKGRGNEQLVGRRSPLGERISTNPVRQNPSPLAGEGRVRGVFRSLSLGAISALLTLSHAMADVAAQTPPGTNDLTVAVSPNVVTNDDTTSAASVPAALPGFAPAARVATPQDTNVSSAAASMPLIAQHPPLSTASEDIRDIRPPIHIPNQLMWAICVASGLAAAGLVFGTWYWLTHHTRRKQLWERALEELEKTRELMIPEQAYLFSIAVSEIVRVYIEERFRARAAHRTTEEFLHDLLAEDHQQLAAYRPLLADFLEHCDLAKFARWELSMEQMEAMHKSACTFVVETGKPADPKAQQIKNQKPKVEHHATTVAA